MSLMLLEKISQDDVRQAPWPHILVQQALPDEVCRQLIEAIPKLADFSRTKFTDRAFPKGVMASNKRLQHMMPSILNEGGIWADFVLANTGEDHQKKFIEVFGPSMLKAVPDFEKRVNPLDQLRHNQFRVMPHNDIGWSVHVGANTPVLDDASSVLADPHLDAPTKMCFGLLYLRHPDDDSEGGDLLVYDGDKVAATVKYERGTLVLGINSPKSIHCVTPRQPTKYPRFFANLYAEVHKDLFIKPEGY